jgi:hypothetical protein
MSRLWLAYLIVILAIVLAASIIFRALHAVHS